MIIFTVLFLSLKLQTTLKESKMMSYVWGFVVVVMYLSGLRQKSQSNMVFILV